LDLAGAAVYQNLKELVVVAIRAGVNRKQQVFESDVVITGLRTVDPLFVTADVIPNIVLNCRRNNSLRVFESLGEVDLITLRFESRQERGLVRS